MSILECETEVGDLFIQSFKTIRFPLSDSISEEKKRWSIVFVVMRIESNCLH